MPRRRKPKTETASEAPLTFTHSVKTQRFLVVEIDGDHKEIRNTIKAYARQCSHYINSFISEWYRRHYEAGTIDKLRQWEADGCTVRLRDLDLGFKCPVQAVYSNPGGLSLGQIANRDAPNLQAEVQSALKQVAEKLILKTKPVVGDKSAWAWMLVHRQRLPFSIGYHPIPFPPSAFFLEQVGEDWWVTVKMGAIPSARRSTRDSITYRFRIGTRGKRERWAPGFLRRIISGELRAMGSKIVVFDQYKLGFQLTYQAPSRVAPDLRPDIVAAFTPLAGQPSAHGQDVFRLIYGTEETATLKKSADGKARLRFVGRDGIQRSNRPGGHGGIIAGVRRRVNVPRYRKQANYCYTKGAKHGHGTTRAIQAWSERHARLWRDFTREYIEQTTRRAIDCCVARKAGRLIYYQPSGKRAERMLASRVGGASGSFDWFKIGQRLKQKGEAVGVKVEVRKNERRTKETTDQGEGDAA